MLTLTLGSVATLLAIYLAAFWLLAQTLMDYAGTSKKGNRSLLQVSLVMFGLILGVELVGFLFS
jgi:hypothetical protein